jgi:rfaE bifunctional protein kinase chain/domain/rfaE bifunctional protein nucleotidyltransferase chain/domain
MKSKIKNINELPELIDNLKSKGKIVIHCHGVFDLLHIGHIKHFEEAKSLGDVLIVSITPDQYVHKGPGRPAFSTSLRLEALAALENIDFVVSNESPTAIEIIKIIKPNIYVKGPDYSDQLNDLTGKIVDEEDAVNSIGGKIHYTDDITFSSSSLLNKHGNVYSQEQSSFVDKLNKKFEFQGIKSSIDSLKKLKVLIIGEIIIDQYIFCEALGKSGKEPILALRDLETQEYLGGVLAIARHLNEFCEEVSILSFLGENREYESFIEDKIEGNIKLNLLTKSKSPTIVKRRFVDNIDRKKILGVYSINDNFLTEDEENTFLSSIDMLSDQHDLVIVSDYGHGIITSKIAEYISNIDKFVSLNAQVNAANIGTHNIRKYRDIDSLIINANELRHEMRQRDGNLKDLAIKIKGMMNAKFITVTQGKDGAFLIDNEKNEVKSPGFASKVVDKVGSGDALLAILSVALFNKMDDELALFIASIAAAQSVETIGNSLPVNKQKLLKTISHALK